jgi:DNA-binding NtrC family response regulator
MIRTEMEIAFRVIWEPSRPLSLPERELLLRSIGLAKDLQIIRGKSTQELEQVEAKLREIPTPAETPASVPLYIQEQNAEREAIISALNETGGHKRRAAELLGISHRAFYNRCARYGIARGWTKTAAKLPMFIPSDVEKPRDE